MTKSDDIVSYPQVHPKDSTYDMTFACMYNWETQHCIVITVAYPGLLNVDFMTRSAASYGNEIDLFISLSLSYDICHTLFFFSFFLQ